MRLMFVGDLSLGEHFFSFGHGPRSVVDSGVNLFRSVEKILTQADYVVGNLEGPLSDIGYNSDQPRSRVFRGSPKSISQLKNCRINILNVANNHILQHGELCFYDTIKKLKASKLYVIGLANQIEMENALIVKGNDGVKIGLLAASDSQENIIKKQNFYATFQLNLMCDAIKRLSQKCDFVFVILHWGFEGLVAATRLQKYMAEKLFNAGAKLIVGHHPHVFFEIERIGDGVVAYSLGNFVFDLPWDKKLTKTGILDLEIDRNAGISSIKVWPVNIETNGIPLISGKPFNIPKNFERFNLYRHPNRLKNQKLKKLLFFLRHFNKGRILLKTRFLLWKIKNIYPQK